MSLLKVCHISDSHNLHRYVKIDNDVDIIIHTGDMTNHGTRDEMCDFLEWWDKLPPTYKILVPGNHDICFDKSKFEGYYPYWLTILLEPYLKWDALNFLLINQSCEIQTINFYGSPYTPKVRPHKETRWAFSEERWALNSMWPNIPKNTDVLLTHGPAYGHHDWCNPQQDYVGCESLRWNIQRVKPKVHLFGHIHESYGNSYDQHTIYSNTSLVDYAVTEIINKPFYFSIDDETKEIVNHIYERPF